MYTTEKFIESFKRKPKLLFFLIWFIGGVVLFEVLKVTLFSESYSEWLTRKFLVQSVVWSLMYGLFFHRKNLKLWIVFRFLGAAGLLIGSTEVFLKWTQLEMGQNFYFGLMSPEWKWIVIISSTLIAIGEFIFYLDNLKLTSEKLINQLEKMTCPRCYGKGFVDFYDIERLGMEEKWGQGYCRYCDGEGKVKMGKTKESNPLDTQIGPGIHESDFID